MTTLKHNFDLDAQRRGTDAKKYDPSLVPNDVIPMWIADTDFTCPQPVVDALMKRAAMPHYGYPYLSNDFQKAIIRWNEVRFGWTGLTTEMIEFVPCIIPGMIYAIREFSNMGDKVLIQTPVYPPFHDAVKNNGRQLIYNELVLNNGEYEIDWADLENKLKDIRTKIFIICNPQNPTGKVFTKEELEKMAKLAIENDVLILCDEIHEDLVFSGNKHIPLASISQEIAQHTITFKNPAKTFNIAGFRTAAVIIPNLKLKAAFHEAALKNKAIGRNIFGDVALIAAYNECDYYADQLVEYLEETRDMMLEFFETRIPKIKMLKPNSTFLAWLDCRELGFETQAELKKFFKEVAKLELNDGTSFGADAGKGFMRINFAAPRATVVEALNRLEAAVKTLA